MKDLLKHYTKISHAKILFANINFEPVVQIIGDYDTRKLSHSVLMTLSEFKALDLDVELHDQQMVNLINQLKSFVKLPKLYKNDPRISKLGLQDSKNWNGKFYTDNVYYVDGVKMSCTDEERSLVENISNEKIEYLYGKIKQMSMQPTIEHVLRKAKEDRGY